MHGNFSCFLDSLKFYRMYGSFLKNRCKIASNIMKWYCNFIEKLPYVRKFSKNRCKIDSKIMKWYCNFIENLPYVRKFLHIFWVGNLVNINFWPLTLTVFINFDGCWIMVVKNTPFFQVFQLSKISRKSQKLTNFCFVFFF